jgi:hypothetical protein
MLNHM